MSRSFSSLIVHGDPGVSSPSMSIDTLSCVICPAFSATVIRARRSSMSAAVIAPPNAVEANPIVPAIAALKNMQVISNS